MRRDSKVKKTAFHFIFGRTVIVALLLLLQFALLIFLMGVVGTLTAYLTVVISAVLVVVVITAPGRNFPFSSASKIICSATRSLMLPAGLFRSSFTKTSAPIPFVT